MKKNDTDSKWVHNTHNIPFSHVVVVVEFIQNNFKVILFDMFIFPSVLQFFRKTN